MTSDKTNRYSTGLVSATTTDTDECNLTDDKYQVTTCNAITYKL